MALAGTQNLRKPVYDRVRQSLATGEWEEGQILSLRKVARQMGVSHTPVREAFIQLELEGLVEPVHKKGIRPKQLNRDELKQLFEMRMMLESGAARLAADAMTDQDLDELGSIVKENRRLELQIRDEMRLSDSAELWQLKPCVMRQRAAETHYRFHLMIIQATHNDLLAKTMGNMHILTRLLNSPILLPEHGGYLKRVARDYAYHRRILRALRKRDGQAASQLVFDHIRDAMEYHLKLYDWKQSMLRMAKQTQEWPSDFLRSVETMEEDVAVQEESSKGSTSLQPEDAPE